MTDSSAAPNMKKVNQSNGPTVNLNTVLTYGMSLLAPALIVMLLRHEVILAEQGKEIDNNAVNMRLRIDAHAREADQRERRMVHRVEQLETWTRDWPQTGELKVDVRQNEKLKQHEKQLAEIHAALKDRK